MREEKNFNESPNALQNYVKDSSLRVSYGREKKLVAALFIVTDLMDINEPIRHRLRTIGTDVLSDSVSLSHQFAADRARLLVSNIDQAMSFLDIASTIGLLSEMNARVLRKEFTAYRDALEDALHKFTPFGSMLTVSDFFSQIEDEQKVSPVDIGNTPDQISEKNISVSKKQELSKGQLKGQSNRTSIGLQSGASLMHALKGVDVKTPSAVRYNMPKSNLEITLNQTIKDVLKDKPNGLTISEVSNALQVSGYSVHEKKLQRELVSMIASGVLYKTGTKRWSRYFLKR